MPSKSRQTFGNHNGNVVPFAAVRCKCQRSAVQTQMHRGANGFLMREKSMRNKACWVDHQGGPLERARSSGCKTTVFQRVPCVGHGIATGCIRCCDRTKWFSPKIKSKDLCVLHDVWATFIIFGLKN